MVWRRNGSQREYDMKKLTVSLIIFILFEIWCSLYVISSSLKDDNYLFLIIGVIFLILSFMLFLLKNLVRVVNIIFSILFLSIYFILYWDLLIRRGFIVDISDPFFLMGFVIHLPVILFNVVAIIFLSRKETKVLFYTKR